MNKRPKSVKGSVATVGVEGVIRGFRGKVVGVMRVVRAVRAVRVMWVVGRGKMARPLPAVCPAPTAPVSAPAPVG